MITVSRWSTYVVEFGNSKKKNAVRRVNYLVVEREGVGKRKLEGGKATFPR
jgi:hypothetical protein